MRRPLRVVDRGNHRSVAGAQPCAWDRIPRRKAGRGSRRRCVQIKSHIEGRRRLRRQRLSSGQGNISGCALEKIAVGIDQVKVFVEVKLSSASVIARARAVAHNEKPIAADGEVSDVGSRFKSALSKLAIGTDHDHAVTGFDLASDRRQTRRRS